MRLLRRIWNWLRSLFGGKHREAAQYEQSVKEMEEALGSMKAQTQAAQAAQEKRRREEAQCRDEIAKMARYAEKAVAEGRDADARFFLEKKETAEKRLQEFERVTAQVSRYTDQAEELCRQAESQLANLSARHDAVEAKMAAAKLAQSMSELENGGILQNRDAQAQAALDKAEAMAELDGRKQESDLDELMRKYDAESAGGTSFAGRPSSGA